MKAVTSMRLNNLSLSSAAMAPVVFVWIALLVGCTTPGVHAPIEDRNTGVRPLATATTTPTSTALAEPPGVASTAPVTSVATPIPLDAGSQASVRPLLSPDNAGKPGFYTVKPGETLYRVGLESGQNWKDIAKWNNIDSTHKIEPGQVLRVSPPAIVSRPEPRSAEGKDPKETKLASGSEPTPIVTAPVIGMPSPTILAPVKDDDDLQWLWPSGGVVLTTFDEGKSKGITLGGKAGDPVLASADGRVVYAGSGLRGYGNLVILKHNATYLTAYAHNQTLSVKEDQTVKRGQKIAEIGSSDADRVQLHFEIRKQGKPVDPLKLLPTR